MICVRIKISAPKILPGWRCRLMCRKSAAAWVVSPAPSAWEQSVTTLAPKQWLDPFSMPTYPLTGELIYFYIRMIKKREKSWRCFCCLVLPMRQRGVIVAPAEAFSFPIWNLVVFSGMLTSTSVIIDHMLLFISFLFVSLGKKEAI